VRVVTAQGMQLQGITPTFFAVPNGFPSAASPVIRHTPSSPAPRKYYKYFYNDIIKMNYKMNYNCIS